MGFKVLIAVDSSGQALRAFDFYFEHLHRPENVIVVTHAAEQPTLPAMSLKKPLSFPAEHWSEQLNKCQKEANKVEADYINRLVEQKVQYKVRMLHAGKPGELICEVAKEEGVDLIVIGTRGQSQLRRTILGSVSDYVVHHVNCPVTICPPPEK